MEFFGGGIPEHLDAFITSLGIGLLIGLERERRAEPKAGLRTFALVALLGSLAAMIGEKAGSGWVLAVGLIAVAAMMIVTGLEPHRNRMMPPRATAATTLADVQLAAVPLPIQ